MNIQRKFGRDAIVHWQARKTWAGMPITFTQYFVIEVPGRSIRLVQRKGFLYTEIDEIHLYRINDFSVFKSLSNKIFGVGNIDIHYSDRGDQHSMRVTRVKGVYEAYELLTRLYEVDRTNRGIIHTAVRR